MEFLSAPLPIENAVEIFKKKVMANRGNKRSIKKYRGNGVFISLYSTKPALPCCHSDSSDQKRQPIFRHICDFDSIKHSQQPAVRVLRR